MLWYTRFSQITIAHAAGNTTDTTADYTRVNTIDWYYIKDSGVITLDFQTTGGATTTYGGNNSIPSPNTTFPLRTFYDDQATIWGLMVAAAGITDFVTVNPRITFGARPILIHSTGTTRMAGSTSVTSNASPANGETLWSDAIYFPNMTNGGPGTIPFGFNGGIDFAFQMNTAGTGGVVTCSVDFSLAQLCSRG